MKQIRGKSLLVPLSESSSYRGVTVAWTFILIFFHPGESGRGYKFCLISLEDFPGRCFIETASATFDSAGSDYKQEWVFVFAVRF